MTATVAAPKPAVSVLLADHRATHRDNLRRGLERSGVFRVVAEAGTASEAAELSASLQPDAIVIDLTLPRGHGTSAIRSLRRRSPASKIVALLASSPDRAEHDGGVVYLDKTAAPARVSSALASLCEGC
jgi:two-component system invasion response regulator UvrY